MSGAIKRRVDRLAKAVGARNYRNVWHMDRLTNRERDIAKFFPRVATNGAFRLLMGHELYALAYPESLVPTSSTSPRFKVLIEDVSSIVSKHPKNPFPPVLFFVAGEFTNAGDGDIESNQVISCAEIPTDKV